MSAREDRIGRVTAALRERGWEGEVVRLGSNTSTAALAAQALGCEVRQIVKSLVFVGPEGGPVLALIGGSRRVDPAKLAAEAGGEVGKASAEQVRESTGFGIGGVAPVGHTGKVRTFMDRGLMEEARVWAAAGSAHAVFPAAPGELLELAGARLADLSQEP